MHVLNKHILLNQTCMQSCMLIQDHLSWEQLFVTFRDKNQPYCADIVNWFWVKATITNYNLWTIATANLKSLAHVLMERWANM